MSGGLRARVELVFAASDAGGLSSALPSGNRALLLKFGGGEDSLEQISLGAMITTPSGEDLEPGASKLGAELLFWADESHIHATPGTRFELWCGRSVGEGVILDFVADFKD